MKNNELYIPHNLFENPKIVYLVSLPDGPALVIIWLHLICLAFKHNTGGLLYLTKQIPYTVDSLAALLNISKEMAKYALYELTTLELIKMTDENYIRIADWHEKKLANGRIKVSINLSQ